MAFLKRIRMVIMFMFLRSYSADSNMEESHFSHNHPSLKRLIEPLSYEVALHLPFKEDDHIFSGLTSYLLIIESPTRKIYLHANGLTIIQMSLTRYPDKEIYSIKDYYYSNEMETLIIDFETDVPSGFYTMVSKFKGNISEKEIGVYRTSCKDCNGTLKWIFTTQLKPTAARRVFPCWDEPSLKARFALQITHNRNYTVLSNMPIKVQMSLSPESMMRTLFYPTPTIPVYLVAFSLTDFVCNDEKTDGFTTRVCCRSLVKHQTIFALNTSIDVMSYLRRYMNISWQLSEITHIGLPDFPHEAIENWGLNIYRESHLIYNETLHSIDHKLNVSTYVASMVAFQWFGNLVSPIWWTHMWLLQTLALFYGAKAAAKTFPDEDISSLFTYRLQSLAREDNAVSKMHPVTYGANNQDEFDKLIKSYHFTNCLREYAIMVMLENVITRKIFRNAITKYLKKHQFSYTTPNDFWNAMQDEYNKKVVVEFYYQHPVVYRMYRWLKQRSLPVIMVSREFDNNIVRREYMNTEEDSDNIDNLWIPINYVSRSHPERVTDFFWLQGYESRSLPQISLLDWIIVNLDQTGYYRVRYDDWFWQELTNYLNSTDYAKIYVLSRARFIEDAHYFWSQKKLHISKFIDLISYMGREKQCAPWYAMEKVIQKMWTFLNIDLVKPLRGVILDVLNTTLQEVGYTEHPGDTDCVKFRRLIATKWACRLFHEECFEIAEEKLLEHLSYPNHIIPPMWEEWTYCNGLVLSDIYIWNEVFWRSKITKNTKILEYLGCCRDSSIIIDYLDHFTSGDSSELAEFELTVEYRHKIYRSIVERHIRDNNVFDYAMWKLLKMIKDDESFHEHFSCIVEKVYSSTRLDKIKFILKKDIFPNSADYPKWISPILERQYFQISKLEQLVN